MLIFAHDPISEPWPKPQSWHALETLGGRKAIITTPNGLVGSLMAHDIAPDGTVTPSVLIRGHTAADSQPAEFHDFIRLDGWEG